MAIFKKGLKQSVGNYHPVILMPHACKVFELIIRDAIIKHLYNFNLIKSQQHGYIKNKSYLTNLLKFLETITDMVDHGLPVDVTDLDFQKAINKVPHRRLLLELKVHGIGGRVSD